MRARRRLSPRSVVTARPRASWLSLRSAMRTDSSLGVDNPPGPINSQHRYSDCNGALAASDELPSRGWGGRLDLIDGSWLFHDVLYACVSFAVDYTRSV